MLDNLQSLQSLERLQNLERLESLQSLQRLEKLQNLQNLENQENFKNLEIHQGCYKKVELPDPSECVIYCDPPYIHAAGYIGDFNHDEFYDWCIEKAKQGYKVFISEYDMPRDRFKSVFNVDKRQLLSVQGSGKLKQEHLFVPII